MSTHYKTLEKTCPKCGTPLVRAHMKNPFIDDFADECPKCEPGEAFKTLTAWSRSAARAEEKQEREERNNRFEREEEK